MRLVQLQRGPVRRVAVVEEPGLRLVDRFESVYALVQAAVELGIGLRELTGQHLSTESLPYDPIYRGESEWKLLPPIDHPGEPARCLVSGTGLTHLGSAKDRQAMHKLQEAELTDSMKMFRWGVEGGQPPAGSIGVAPEWFYKGTGTILRAHGEPLLVPAHAEDGGEEGEVAGVYFIAPDGQPRRIGMATGNEFSDHKFEKRNYLNLAGSKIRTCALGPELVLEPEFNSIAGKVTVMRGNQELWARDICTGEAEMCHSLRNIEQHHFKFETHRRPGDVHVHYYGACSLSFGAGVQLTDGDLMQIEFAGFGRALQNRISIAPGPAPLITVRNL